MQCEAMDVPMTPLPIHPILVEPGTADFMTDLLPFVTEGRKEGRKEGRPYLLGFDP